MDYFNCKDLPEWAQILLHHENPSEKERSEAAEVTPAATYVEHGAAA